jgi:glycopeptide antibiotics resistance protein
MTAMKHFEDRKQTQIKVPSFFLLGIGIGFMIFIVFFDYFHSGPAQFGKMQFSALVVSAIVILAGLRKLTLLKARFWDGLLLFIYFSGILFMGLKAGSNHSGSDGLLRVFWPPLKDLVINILGFFPLSYLMMSFFLSDKRVDKLKFVAGMIMTSGICISLTIEILQYYIPGRSSSFFDVLANGFGMFIGVSYYLLEKNYQKSCNFTGEDNFR